MSTYAIGDIQGCLAPLERLLRRLDFRPGADVLWLVGDLVNRGPDSLGVLRLLRGLGAHAICVLGNHDLRLLSIAYGLREPRPNDTLTPLLQAPDRDELIAWLRGRPLLYRQGPHAMVHAGLLPSWTLADAQARAQGISELLRGADPAPFLARLGTEVPGPRTRLTDPIDVAVYDAKVLTYLRVCDAAGEPHLEFSGTVANVPPGCVPWFIAPQRRHREVTWVCGHWSALGLHVGDGIVALDTGCVWGRTLTAMRLDDGVLFSEPADPVDNPDEA